MDMDSILSGKPGRSNDMPFPECTAGRELLPELGGPGWIRQVKGVISLTDSNKDSVITQKELVESYNSQPTQCNQRIVASMLKNFELMTKIAPESLEELDTADVPIEAFKETLKESLVDSQKDSAGISQKDLAVAEMVLERPRLLSFIDDAKKFGPTAMQQIEREVNLRRQLLLSVKNNS